MKNIKNLKNVLYVLEIVFCISLYNLSSCFRENSRFNFLKNKKENSEKRSVWIFSPQRVECTMLLEHNDGKYQNRSIEKKNGEIVQKLKIIIEDIEVQNDKILQDIEAERQFGECESKKQFLDKYYNNEDLIKQLKKVSSYGKQFMERGNNIEHFLNEPLLIDNEEVIFKLYVLNKEIENFEAVLTEVFVKLKQATIFGLDKQIFDVLEKAHQNNMTLKNSLLSIFAKNTTEDLLKRQINKQEDRRLFTKNIIRVGVGVTALLATVLATVFYRENERNKKLDNLYRNDVTEKGYGAVQNKVYQEYKQDKEDIVADISSAGDAKKKLELNQTYVTLEDDYKNEKGKYSYDAIKKQYFDKEYFNKIFLTNGGEAYDNNTGMIALGVITGGFVSERFLNIIGRAVDAYYNHSEKKVWESFKNSKVK